MRITRLEHQKSTITLFLDHGQSVVLVKEVLGEFYLYTNKELTEEELEAIKNYSAMVKHYQYTLRILAKALYSEHDIIKKLRQRDLKEETISLIITRLKNNNLLNDENYARSLFNYYLKRGAGPLLIRRKLESKNIEATLIDEIVKIDDDLAFNQALLVGQSFAKKQKNIAKSALLQKIYSKLTRDGYPAHVTGLVLEELKESLTDHDRDALVKDYPRMYLKVSQKHSDEKVIEEETIKKLIQKGYRYGAIRKYLEEKNVY